MINAVSIVNGHTHVTSLDATLDTYIADLTDLMITRGFATSKLIKNYDEVSGLLHLLAPNEDIDWAYFRKENKLRHISEKKVTR